MGRVSIAIVSDIHYACAAEQARGNDFELRSLENPVLRTLLRWHRRHVWLRDPLSHNDLLDAFLRQAAGCDFAVANGDYTCNTGFIGVADDAACESVRECLGKLRRVFASPGTGVDGRLRATMGDHELGKVSFAGGQGGMRLASWRRASSELGLQPLWQLRLDRYHLLGIASSIVALPVFERDTAPEERPEWERIRAAHLAEIQAAFEAVRPEARVILFCHDPTALPFLLELESVRARLGQLELTVIGHLHTRLVFRLALRLAGMPRITWLGHTARRMSTALRAAGQWRAFHPRLCPSLAGTQLLKDGGWSRLLLDPDGVVPAQMIFHPVWRP